MNNSVVLDNSVLSSFRTAQWFSSLGELAENYDLIASAAIWEEFEEESQIDEPPSWLTVEQVDRLPYFEEMGRVSVQDLTCIALGEIYSGMVVANDMGLKRCAAERGLETRWGTRFLLDIFESCLISTQELEEGKGRYIQDLYLNNSVEKAIHQAKKPK